MDVDERAKNTDTPSYPQNVDEWRETICKALNRTPEECKILHQTGTFPFDDLIVWICREFSSNKGYSPDFVPALIRNRNGLIAWVYGKGSEPHWPGEDESTC